MIDKILKNKACPMAWCLEAREHAYEIDHSLGLQI